MKRKIYNRLLEWKEEQHGESAVLINGAHRVGKSYIVKEFAQKEYKSYIVMDLKIAGKNIKELLENSVKEADKHEVNPQILFGRYKHDIGI